MSYITTIASSATVIPFNAQPADPPKAAKLSFAQARDAWLRPLQADSRFTDGEFRVCVAVYFGFNSEHYEKTGQLLSWPGWLKLEGETTKCERTIARTFKKLERLGALQILRGGFDPKTRQRRPNKYLAKFGHLTLGSGGPPDTSDGIHLTEPPVSRVRRLDEGLDDSDSMNQSNLTPESGGNPRGPSAPEGRKQARHFKPSNSSPSASPQMNGAAAPTYVGYASPLMVRLEEYERSTGKSFPRDRRGGWWLTPDQLAAIGEGDR